MKALHALPIALIFCLLVCSAIPRSAHAQTSPLDPVGASGLIPVDPQLPSGFSSEPPPSSAEEFHLIVDFAAQFWPRLALASWVGPTSHRAPVLRSVMPARLRRLGF